MRKNKYPISPFSIESKSAKLNSSSDTKMITEVGIPLPGNKLGDQEDFDVKCHFWEKQDLNLNLFAIYFQPSGSCSR